MQWQRSILKSAGVVALLCSQEHVTVSGYFLIRNSFFPDSKISPSTRYRSHCGFIKCHSGERLQKISGFTGSACGRKLSTLLFTNFGGTRSNVTTNSQNLFTTIKSTTLLKATLKIGSLTRQLVPPMAIMTSRRCAKFSKWRHLLSQIQLFAGFSNHFSFKWYYVWISRSKYYCSFLRGKWILIIRGKSCTTFI